MKDLVKILVAHYSEEHTAGACVWPEDIFTPWDVRFNAGSRLLEYDLLKKMRAENIMDDYKYSGLLSHSAFGKLAMPINYVYEQIRDGVENDVDLIILNPAIACNAFFRNGIEQAQMTGQNKIEFIFSKLGYAKLMKATLPYYSFIMCSYIIAKKSFWDIYFDWVDETLRESVKLAESDIEFSDALYSDSNYQVKPNQFDYRPFVIERIPQIIISLTPLKMKYIEAEKSTFALKFGHTAKLVYQMYQMKKSALNDSNFERLWDDTRQPFVAGNAFFYKMAAHGEFYRSELQAKENMSFIRDGNFI